MFNLNDVYTLESLSSAYTNLISKKSTRGYQIYLTSEGFQTLSTTAARGMKGLKALNSEMMVDFEAVHKEPNATEVIANVNKILNKAKPKLGQLKKREAIKPIASHQKEQAESIQEKTKNLQSFQSNEKLYTQEIVPQKNSLENSLAAIEDLLKQLSLCQPNTAQACQAAKELHEEIKRSSQLAANISGQMHLFKPVKESFLDASQQEINREIKETKEMFSRFSDVNKHKIIQELKSEAAKLPDYNLQVKVEGLNQETGRLDKEINTFSEDFNIHSVRSNTLDKINHLENRLKNHLSEIAKLKHDHPVLSNEFESTHSLGTAIDMLQNIKKNLEQFNPSHFHNHCSEARADELLKRRPNDSYLIREATNSFVISYVKDKKVHHLNFKISEKGVCSETNELLGKNLDQVLKNLMGSSHPIPYQDIPLHHSLAQFEWNLTVATEEEMLNQAIPGGCFITSEVIGEYTLHIFGEDQTLTHYPISVKNDKIYCLIGGEEKKVRSLYDLITKDLGLDYHILYDRPLDSLSTFEQLYYRNFLPTMLKSGLEWSKVSRQKYKQLPKSVWFNAEGQFYKQSHASDFVTAEGLKVFGGNKVIKGEGGFKIVYELDQFYQGIHSQDKVRARFSEELTAETEAPLETLKKLKQKANDDHLLLPYSFTYKLKNGLVTVMQVMPTMQGGDLLVAAVENKLTYLGTLRAMRDACLGLMAMHDNGFVHLDIKPENIFLETTDPNNPKGKVGDFDLVHSFESQEECSSNFSVGTLPYIDPFLYKKIPYNLDCGKVMDQFSLGVTFFRLLTGRHFRSFLDEALFAQDVNVAELEESKAFQTLDPRLQQMIKGCCIGPLESRPYLLPQIVQLLDELIAEQKL